MCRGNLLFYEDDGQTTEYMANKFTKTPVMYKLDSDKYVDLPINCFKYTFNL